MNSIRRSRNGFPPSALTNLTLALMLAACGGGGDGNNTTTSASSGTPMAGATNSATSNSSASVIVNAHAPASNATDTAIPPDPAERDTDSDEQHASPQPPGGDGSNSVNSPNQADNTNPPSPPPASSMPADIPLISEQGVRGDVFLAMLEQKPCSGTSVTPVPAPDGSLLSESLDYLIINTDLGNYWITPGHPRGGYDNIMGCNHHHYATVKPGNHTYSLSHSYFGKIWRPSRPWEELKVSFPVTLTEDEVSIGQHFENVHSNKGYPITRTFSADAPFKIGLKALLPFGTAKTWSKTSPIDPATPEFMKMMLLKDDASPRDARLCWNVDFSFVKRLQCIHWRIPENWQFGQLLAVMDQTLVEDRSVYPNESGLAYWRAHWRARDSR